MQLLMEKKHFEYYAKFITEKDDNSDLEEFSLNQKYKISEITCPKWLSMRFGCI